MDDLDLLLDMEDTLLDAQMPPGEEYRCVDCDLPFHVEDSPDSEFHRMVLRFDGQAVCWGHVVEGVRLGYEAVGRSDKFEEWERSWK